MLVLILIAVIILIYVYFKRSFTYWESRGFLSIPAQIPLGSKGLIGTKEHPSEYFKRHYEEFKHKTPAIGVYAFTLPALAIIDPELIKDVYTKHFDSFHERGMSYNKEDDPLLANLFSFGGQEWKNLRVKLTPTFTSGKMKMMFPLVTSTGDRMIDYLKPFADRNEPLDMKEVYSSFTVETIASVAFGLEIECHGKPDSEFKNIAKSLFQPTPAETLKAFFIYCFPKIAKVVGMSYTPKKISDFFMGVIRDTLEYREKNKVERNDFLQLLINMKNSGEGMTFNEMAGNSFIFYFAG
jgi:cytochrome P450 family 6